MSQYSDIILLSKCIFSPDLNQGKPFSGFVAIKAQYIQEIGYSAEGHTPEHLIGPQTKVYDLGNQTISPGFIDTHCFFSGWATEAIGKNPENPEELKNVLQDKSYIIPKFNEYMQMMNSRGITTVKEMGFDDFYGFTDILDELDKKLALTLRVHFMSQPMTEPINIEYGKKMRDKFQGSFVRFSGYNQMTDGSISQLCGELKEPYCCKPSITCAQEINWKQLEADTLLADKEDFRFSLHAQGDAAIAHVIDIFSKCKFKQDGKIMNRHAITDLEFSDPVDLRRMGELGIVAEIYPQIQSIATRDEKIAMIENTIGMDRGKYFWNRRGMIDSGVVVSCGTDLPLLIDDIPESVYHAVGGYFPDSDIPFNTTNMITREELMSAWTYNGAYNLMCEDTLGSLAPGKLADIAILSDNIFTTPLESIYSISVCMTIVNGSIVFER